MMAGQPLISVIVPAYNAAGTIDFCLEALEHQTFPRELYEIVVVDDGSSDSTRARIESHAGVRLLTQQHAGPAAARNRGVQHAQGAIVLFTDCDCEPIPGWIEYMVAPFHNEGIVGVKGAYLTRQREIVARFVQIEYEDKYDRMARQEFIDFVDTYAAGYRRDIFVGHGGFDASFPVASVEDQEFSFRLARQGCKMVFVPEARVYHRGHAQNLWSYCRRKFGIGYWKVWVTKRYPEKLLRDSHTPQVLKAQILLVELAGLCLLGSVFWPPLGWGGGLLGLLFLLTTIPFSVKAWHKEPLVAALAPGLLLVRAVTLGTGFALGLLVNRSSGRRVEERRRAQEASPPPDVSALGPSDDA